MPELVLWDAPEAPLEAVLEEPDAGAVLSELDELPEEDVAPEEAPEDAPDEEPEELVLPELEEPDELPEELLPECAGAAPPTVTFRVLLVTVQSL